jgi:hypothetical protein
MKREILKLNSSQSGPIRLAIEAGWQSAQREEFVDAEEVFARIEKELTLLEASQMAPITTTSTSTAEG